MKTVDVTPGTLESTRNAQAGTPARKAASVFATSAPRNGGALRAALLFALPVVALAPFVVAACSSSESSNPAVDDSSPDSSTKPSKKTPDSGDPEFPSCPRTAKAEDRARKVVISHPYGEGGAKTNNYEVLELSTDGTLTRTNDTFTMGRGLVDIAFTPDGEVGLLAQEGGSVGVFAFDASGKVRVVHEAFKDQFYADRVVVARDGSRAFLLDQQSNQLGGGVHEVRIGCDGTLTYVGLVVPGGNAHAMAFLPNDPDRALLVARAALDSATGDYAHRIDFTGEKPARLASGKVFTDSDAIASWVGVTPDGKWALVTDNGLMKGNRMAAVALDTMKPTATITVANPAAVAMSPFGNAALLLESDGEDALRVVAYDSSNATEPFKVGAEVAYKDGKKTEIPTLAVTIDRGTLKGRVFVSEVQTVRQLAFSADGNVTDLGVLDFSGDGMPGMVGALGIQP